MAKDDLKEGINGEWTKEINRRNDENLKSIKKFYGDFRTAIGKANKDRMKELASGMTVLESTSDYDELYIQTVFDMVTEVEDLTDLISEYDKSSETKALRDWKMIARSLEDVRDQLLKWAPSEPQMSEEEFDQYLESLSDNQLELLHEGVVRKIGRGVKKAAKGVGKAGMWYAKQSAKTVPAVAGALVGAAATGGSAAGFAAGGAAGEAARRAIAAKLKKRREMKQRQQASLKKESLYEDFKTGNMKLDDGSSYNLSSNDVSLLNKALKNTKEKTKLMNRAKKNKKELKSILDLAKEL